MNLIPNKEIRKRMGIDKDTTNAIAKKKNTKMIWKSKKKQRPEMD